MLHIVHSYLKLCSNKQPYYKTVLLFKSKTRRGKTTNGHDQSYWVRMAIVLDSFSVKYVLRYLSKNNVEQYIIWSWLIILLLCYAFIVFYYWFLSHCNVNAIVIHSTLIKGSLLQPIIIIVMIFWSIIFQQKIAMIVILTLLSLLAKWFDCRYKRQMHYFVRCHFY